MRKSFLLLTVALMFVLTQGISSSYAQKLLKKLYDDKETVRGGGQKKTTVVTTGEAENEYYYKDTSGLFPNSGTCYIQYYNGQTPERATIIVNNRVTADVILAGLDAKNLNFKNDVYWEVYNHFIYRNNTRRDVLRYKVVGQEGGMHKVVLTMGHTNINQWILKYCLVDYYPTAAGPGPVWLNTGGSWAAPAEKEKKKK